MIEYNNIWIIMNVKVQYDPDKFEQFGSWGSLLDFRLKKMVHTLATRETDRSLPNSF